MGIFNIGNLHELMNSNLPSERLDPEDPIFGKVLDTFQGQTYDAIERILYSYFGSIENIKEYGKDYVLEYMPTDIETSTDGDYGLAFQVRITQKVRLRLKNQEERDAEV